MRISKLLIRTQPWETVMRRVGEWIVDVQNLLNDGLTLKDNFKGNVRDIKYTGGSTLVVFTSLTTRPSTVWCLSAIRTDGVSDVFQSGGIVEWRWTPAGVEIHDIDGLSTGVEHAVRLAILE